MLIQKNVVVVPAAAGLWRYADGRTSRITRGAPPSSNRQPLTYAGAPDRSHIMTYARTQCRVGPYVLKNCRQVGANVISRPLNTECLEGYSLSSILTVHLLSLGPKYDRC